MNVSAVEPLADAQPPTELREAATAGRTWAIGGGKGGIGKSFLAANLAAAAARTGRRVIALDGDLGCANLHTWLGVRANARANLGDFIERRLDRLEEAALETQIARLRLIAGSPGQTATPEIGAARRRELLEAIRELSADLVVLDLAAGVDPCTIDLFLAADENFVVTTPEPTAIENAYAFLRAAVLRRLEELVARSSCVEALEVMRARHDGRDGRAAGEILELVEQVDVQEAARLRRELGSLRPRLVLNQVRTPEEIKLGFEIRSVCRKFFGIELEYVGYVNFDDFVWRSVKERRPLVLTYPHSDGALYIRRIARKVLED